MRPNEAVRQILQVQAGSEVHRFCRVSKTRPCDQDHGLNVYLMLSATPVESGKQGILIQRLITVTVNTSTAESLSSSPSAASTPCSFKSTLFTIADKMFRQHLRGYDTGVTALCPARVSRASGLDKSARNAFEANTWTCYFLFIDAFHIRRIACLG